MTQYIKTSKSVKNVSDYKKYECFFPLTPNVYSGVQFTVILSLSY